MLTTNNFEIGSKIELTAPTTGVTLGTTTTTNNETDISLTGLSGRENAGTVYDLTFKITDKTDTSAVEYANAKLTVVPATIADFTGMSVTEGPKAAPAVTADTIFTGATLANTTAEIDSIKFNNVDVKGTSTAIVAGDFITVTVKLTPNANYVFASDIAEKTPAALTTNTSATSSVEVKDGVVYVTYTLARITA